jgi:Proprotein convertase P-domain
VLTSRKKAQVKSLLNCWSVVVGCSLLLGAASAGCASDAGISGADAVAQEAEEFELARQQNGDCRTSADCRVGAACDGVPADGSARVGKCHAEAAIVGDGESCTTTSRCKTGLRCNGLSMGNEGTCKPSWMSAVYTKASAGAVSSVVAYGLATVPEDIVVRARIANVNLATATITLTDPNGTVATICSTSARCTAAQLAAGVSAAGISRDDQVNGRWTLRIVGVAAAKIQSWSLSLSSRLD